MNRNERKVSRENYERMMKRKKNDEKKEKWLKKGLSGKRKRKT